MKTFDRLSDKIAFYRRTFNEGTILTAEKLMRDYLDFARSRGVDWDEYKDIDPELYTYLLGGAQKLNEEQFREPSWQEPKAPPGRELP